MVRSLLTPHSRPAALGARTGSFRPRAGLWPVALRERQPPPAPATPRHPVDDGGPVSERPVLQDDGGNSTETPTPTPEPTETPTPTPRVHATPEACPANPLDVVSAGHFAVFEVYWDPNGTNAEGHNLTGNLCPPSVVHVPNLDENHVITSWTAQRGAPSFKVSDSEHTVISTLHVLETKKQSLAASVVRYFNNGGHETDSAGTAYNDSDNKRPEDDLDRYFFAYPDEASSESTTDGVTTKTYNRESDFGDHIWALPYCEVEDYDGYTKADDDLCLGFSGGLLDAGDWGYLPAQHDTDGNEIGGPIEYEVRVHPPSRASIPPTGAISSPIIPTTLTWTRTTTARMT